MMRILKYFLLGLSIVFFSCSDDTPPGMEEKETEFEPREVLILISLDGFRYDYISAANTPALDAIQNEGIAAEGLIPVFPTKTFTNHYSQVTGLYAEHHGIIANRFFDPVFNETFSLGSETTTDGKWYEGEPIWVSVENQGKIAATYFWPGSDAEINGVRPTFYRKFDGSVPYHERTNQVIQWLKLPIESRPDFITLYFQSPDSEGHSGGPLSSQVIDAVEEVDNEINDLLKGIENVGLEDYANVIVVSDHGMAQLNRDSAIFLDDYIDLNDVYLINWTPVADIIPNPAKEEAVYLALKDAHPKLSVYKKNEIPEEWHYRSHRRIAPIVAVADESWSITDHAYFDSHPGAYSGGAHGYAPSVKNMWGIFRAKGPAFKKGLSVDPVHNVDLYEMMCKILGIAPASNDGDYNRVKSLLKNP